MKVGRDPLLKSTKHVMLVTLKFVPDPDALFEIDMTAEEVLCPRHKIIMFSLVRVQRDVAPLKLI